jgi:RHS repeat-associated protein
MLASLGSVQSLVAQIVVGKITEDKLFFYISDYVGKPHIIMNDAGEIVWNAEYLPFGGAEVDTDLIVNNHFMFAGQNYDSETGLHYNYHRYYDPKVGRYLRPDPIGVAGGINLYVYAENNSINISDFFGLISPASAAAIKAIMTNPDPNFTPAQRRAAIRAIPPNLPDPNIHNPYMTNDFPTKELVKSLKLDAAGISGEISTINPFTSRSGGVYGLNLEYTSFEGLHLYYYSTPNDTKSEGFDIGVSFTFNVAKGCGSWEGPIDTFSGTYGYFTGGFFHTPLEEEELGYFGFQGGVSAGTPGGGYSRTKYEILF